MLFKNLNQLTHEDKHPMTVFDYFVICPDKMAALDDSADAGAEMTEEEWNLRVAELNKHQVCLCNLEIIIMKNVINYIKIKINQKCIPEFLYRERQSPITAHS